MPATLTFCRCLELRRGCAAIGVCLLLNYGLVGVALTVTAAYAQQHGWRETTALAATAPLALVLAAFHVLLVLGAQRGRPPLLLVWLVGCGGLFTAQTAALLVGAFLLTAGSLWTVLGITAVLAMLQSLYWYWFWAVRSLYLETTTNARRARRLAAADLNPSAEKTTTTPPPAGRKCQEKGPGFGA